MKKSLSIGLALLVICFGSSAQTNTLARPVNSSIAVSIVYDGSGSMLDSVMGAGNVPTPKYQIANKAVNSIVKQLLAYSQDRHVDMQAGLVYFVDGKIHQAIPLAALTSEQATAFIKWTENFKPAGGTPLGQGIQEAARQLSGSDHAHKHVLVITDGMSNIGIAPDKVVNNLRTSANPIPIYFVAFDVSAKLFEPVKSAGAMVVSASNEAELNAQINTILGQKILLEAE